MIGYIAKYGWNSLKLVFCGLFLESDSRETAAKAPPYAATRAEIYVPTVEGQNFTQECW
jgi:hypothetical protein